MARFDRSATRWLLILIVALALRAAGGVWWQARLGDPARFFFGDSESYWVLARSIARGEPYEYLSSDARVLRTPGYPLILAGLFAAYPGEPPVLAARLLGAVWGTAAVGVLGWWTTRLFDARAGEVAGAIAAIYPGAVAISAFVLSEAPFCTLMLLQLAWWTCSTRAVGRSWVLYALVCGAAGGAATLVRPSWLLFTPLVAALAIVTGPDRKRQARRAALIACAFALVMAPWWIRNAQVTGRFVATTLQVGASLYDGLSPAADGSSNMTFVADFEAQERAAPLDPADRDTFEYRLDRRMREAALAWARDNPRRVVELAYVKLSRLWNVWPNEPALAHWPLAVVVLVSYLPLVCLSLWGAWRFVRAGGPYALCCLPAVYLTLLHVVFVASIRYREPAMLALMPLAAAVLAGSAPRRDSQSAAPIASSS